MYDENFVCIPRCDETSVYKSDTGFLVIKQDSSMGDDSTIIIPPQFIGQFVEAIKQQFPEIFGDIKK